jgi:anti-sigma factor RsiW
MMTCRELADILIDYVDGELATSEAERIREHLNECPPCVVYLQTYQLTIRLTRRLPAAEPPAELLERLRAAARQRDS